MAYVKTNWKNREVEKPRTFTMVENQDGTVTLIPAEGDIYEQGTPIVAAVMNNMEDGIEVAHNAIETHLAEDATTTKKGHVQLSTSTSSTSTVLAATPSAVKAAYDKANAALPKAGGTMTGILTAQSNTSYTVRQVRNMILSTADADVNAMQNGDIWIKYK